MSNNKPDLEYCVTNSIKDTSMQDWDNLFDKDIPEGYGYHKTLEESGLKEFNFYYLLARRNHALAAVFPFFTAEFAFATLIQGRLQGIILAIQKIYKSFLRARILFVGFPTTEELYLGISKDENQQELMEGALRELSLFAKREKALIILFYNLAQRHAALAGFLAKKGYAKMENFPGTRIEINAASSEEYLKSLSKNMRKEIRRKLNKISALSLKTEIMEDLDGRALKQVYGLYLNNFADANVQLEKLTPEFFRNICRNMEGQAKYFITRRDGAMVAFNLCLIKNGACVDKFIGFDQRLRREFSLYLYTFCHNLDWCIKNGLRFYQMGQTDYQPKLRLGAKLTPLYVYARFTCNLLNPFGRLFARLIAPVNFDPALKRLKRQAGGPGF